MSKPHQKPYWRTSSQEARRAALRDAGMLFEHPARVREQEAERVEKLTRSNENLAQALDRATNQRQVECIFPNLNLVSGISRALAAPGAGGGKAAAPSRRRGRPRGAATDNLQPWQIEALAILNREPGLSTAAIAERVGRSPSLFTPRNWAGWKGHRNAARQGREMRKLNMEIERF